MGLDINMQIEVVNKFEDKEFSKNLDQNFVSNIIDSLAKYYFNYFKDKASSKYSSRDWYSYEYEIWAMGEKLRHLLVINNKWRGKCELLDTVAKIVQIKDYGKGREPFVLILGSYGKGKYNDELGRLINDEEIIGHVIDSLYKGKAKGYETKIFQIFNTKKGWIKKVAQKYIEKYQEW